MDRAGALLLLTDRAHIEGVECALVRLCVGSGGAALRRVALGDGPCPDRAGPLWFPGVRAGEALGDLELVAFFGGESTPDPEPVTVVQGVPEALSGDRAAGADGFSVGVEPGFLRPTFRAANVEPGVTHPRARCVVLPDHHDTAVPLMSVFPEITTTVPSAA